MTKTMTVGEIRDALAVADNIKTVVKLVAAAAALALSRGKANDVEGYRAALELRLRAERAGGTMASTNKRVPVSKLGIANKVDRWRKLASLDDAVFEKRVAYFHKKLPPGLRPLRDGYAPPGPVVVTMTDWQVDEHGVLSRQKVAEGEKTSA